jgi:hypothetical protein
MISGKCQGLIAMLCKGLLGCLTAGFLAGSAQATLLVPSDDAYVDGGTRSLSVTKFGNQPNLLVGPFVQHNNQHISFLAFDLGALPPGTTSASISKANLILYVNAVASAGTVELRPVTSAWDEAGVNYNNQPSYGKVIATAAVGPKPNDYVVVDITTAVQQWLDYPSTNFGLAILASGATPNTAVQFDSKESSTTSQAAKLDISFVDGATASTTGPQGPVGPAGPQGTAGPVGPIGAQGLKGDVGPIGTQGLKGDTGPVGATGPQGPAGLTGPQGVKGDTGLTGPQGLKGDVGPIGTQGLKGDTGPVGATGPQGPAGLTGPQGVKGDTGLTGAVGPVGPQGLKGDVGPIGTQGLKGDVGPIGTQGLKGDVGPIGTQGPKGDTGMTGAAGPQGLAGLTGPQGVKGDTGLTGPTGAVGPAGPQGLKGDTGLAGPAGASGPQGATGLTGSNGPVGPAGPQGLKGDAGPTGPSGATGPQGPIGLTGPAGPIGPYGATGAPGATGSPGAQGPAGIPGNRTSRVATMQWWKSLSYPVGNNPTGIVFDGFYIWVLNQNDSTLTKISAREGSMIGTYPTRVNPGQQATLTFDGTYIYVSSPRGVTKHAASNGSIVGGCSLSATSGGMAFDGTYVVQVDSGVLLWANAPSCPQINTFLPNVVVDAIHNAVAFDGTNFWAIDTAANILTEFSIQTVNGLPRATIISNYPAKGYPAGPSRQAPVALAYDGSKMWVAYSGFDPNAQSCNLDPRVNGGYQIIGLSGGGFCVSSAPTALASDGTNIWVLSSSGNSVSRVNPAYGSAGSFTTFPVGPSPAGIAFDGDNIWVTNSGNNTVTKIPAF